MTHAEGETPERRAGVGDAGGATTSRRGPEPADGADRDTARGVSPAAVPIRNPAVIRRPQEGGWSVLVNLDNVRTVALNPSADLVWGAVDGRRDAAAIVAFMRGRYRDVPASATDDVTGLLEELAESGFVGYECGRGRPREAERVSRPRQASGATRAVACPRSSR